MKFIHVYINFAHNKIKQNIFLVQLNFISFYKVRLKLFQVRQIRIRILICQKQIVRIKEFHTFDYRPFSINFSYDGTYGRKH